MEAKPSMFKPKSKAEKKKDKVQSEVHVVGSFFFTQI